LWPQGRGGSNPLFRTNTYNLQPNARNERWQLTNG